MGGKTAPGPLLLTLTLLASAAQGQPVVSDLEAVSTELGSPPLYCAELGAERKLCTWHEKRRHHVVCELDAANARTAKPCLRRAEASAKAPAP